MVSPEQITMQNLRAGWEPQMGKFWENENVLQIDLLKVLISVAVSDVIDFYHFLTKWPATFTTFTDPYCNLCGIWCTLKYLFICELRRLINSFFVCFQIIEFDQLSCLCSFMVVTIRDYKL